MDNFQTRIMARLHEIEELAVLSKLHIIEKQLGFKLLEASSTDRKKKKGETNTGSKNKTAPPKLTAAWVFAEKLR